MLESKNQDRRLVLHAVRSFEEDIESLEEQIYEACEAVCQQFALFVIHYGTSGQSAYRYPFSGIEIDPAKAADEAAMAAIQRYLEIENITIRKVKRFREQQEVHKKHLADFTLKTTIRKHPKSDKCMIYTAGPDGMPSLAVHNLYEGSTEMYLPYGNEIIGRQPGIITRCRMRRKGRDRSADVYFVERLTDKITSADVLRHATQVFQQEYDAREPLVAEQRETYRLWTRHREKHLLRKEPDSESPGQLILDYIFAQYAHQA